VKPIFSNPDNILSNAEIILLNLIKSKPSYAYEVEKRIEEKGIRKWVKIGGATVYQVLDRLCKKGLLEFSIEKEGNMPPRKRYHITEQGDLLFKKTSRQILANNEYYYFDLTLGLACRHLLDKDEFESALMERLEKLNSFLDNFNERFEKAKELYPEKRHLIKKYLLSHYKLEQDFIKRLLGENSYDNQ